MARGHSVWCVVDANKSEIIMAFSVKHECAKWLCSREDISQLVVERHYDGKPEGRLVIAAETLVQDFPDIVAESLKAMPAPYVWPVEE